MRVGFRSEKAGPSLRFEMTVLVRHTRRRGYQFRGDFGVKCNAALRISMPAALQSNPLGFGWGVGEGYFGNFSGRGRRREVVVVDLETAPSGENAIRKLADEGVVGLDRIVVALSLDRDAVFGAGQFVL